MSFSTKDFLVEGSQVYKKNFWKLAGVNILIFLIILAIFALFSIIIGVSMNNTIDGYEYGYEVYNNVPISAMILLFLCFLLIIIFAPVLNAGYSFIYVKLAREEKISFLDIFSGFYNFWHVWLTQYFSNILIFGGILLFLLPLLLIFFLTIGLDIINSLPWIMYSNFSVANYSASLVIFLTLFTLVLIIAAIYWVFKFILTGIAAVDKKLNAGKAIFYGSQITNSYKLRIFLATLIPVILYIIVSVLTNFIINEESWISIIISFIFTIFIYTPWLSSIIGVIYNKLSDNPTTDDKESIYDNIEEEKNIPNLSEEIKEDFSIDDNIVKDNNNNFDQDEDKNSVEKNEEDDSIL